jgi:hypothetical protein
MKSIFFSQILISLFAINSFCQTADSKDQNARIKFSVHLIDYMNPPNFENASGEAHYNLIKFAFEENLTIPNFELDNLTNNDKTIIVNYISLLEQSLYNPLPWKQLLELEKQYLIWLDRSNRKVSKYKN